jgi:hypothetical protein
MKLLVLLRGIRDCFRLWRKPGTVNLKVIPED